MGTATLDQLAFIGAELAALRGEVDSLLLADLERLVAALMEADP